MAITTELTSSLVKRPRSAYCKEPGRLRTKCKTNQMQNKLSAPATDPSAACLHSFSRPPSLQPTATDSSTVLAPNSLQSSYILRSFNIQTHSLSPTSASASASLFSPIQYAHSKIRKFTNQIKCAIRSSPRKFLIPPSISLPTTHNISPNSRVPSSSGSTVVMLHTTNNSEMDTPVQEKSPSLYSSSFSSQSPLSQLSRSPSPIDYFQYSEDYESDLSPLSSLSQSTMSISTTPDSSQTDCERPTKRRKISSSVEPRYSPEQELDLSNNSIPDSQQDQLDRLMKLVQNRGKIVVIAGAGISVSAGIPDFRSSKGLFKSLKKEHNLKSSGKDLFDASVYKDADSTSSFHQMLRQLSSMTKEAAPTSFHHLLSRLAAEDRLLRLYTQNVDGLDTSMPHLNTNTPLNRKGPWPKTIQLHGGLQTMVCSKCNTMENLDPDLFDGPTPPLCNFCVAADNARTEYAGKRSHGIGCLRPRMVLYNEHNPDDEAIGAVVKSDLRTRPDALIVVGTTLKIPGVKRIVKEMASVIHGRRHGLVVWINKDDPPPQKDYVWDIIVKGPCDRVADEAALRLWDAQQAQIVSDEEAQRLLQSDRVKVQVPTTLRKKAVEPAFFLTPTSNCSPSRRPIRREEASPSKTSVTTSAQPKAIPIKIKIKKMVASNPRKPLKQKSITAEKKTLVPTQRGSLAVKVKAQPKPRKNAKVATGKQTQSAISFNTSKPAAVPTILSKAAKTKTETETEDENSINSLPVDNTNKNNTLSSLQIAQTVVALTSAKLKKELMFQLMKEKDEQAALIHEPLLALVTCSSSARKGSIDFLLN